jgi:hypothetical protein
MSSIIAEYCARSEGRTVIVMVVSYLCGTAIERLEARLEKGYSFKRACEEVCIGQ